MEVEQAIDGVNKFLLLFDVLINEGAVLEWKGNFIKSENDSGGDRVQRDFFGFPLKPPFYVGVGGMQNVSKSIINRILSKDQEEQEGKAFFECIHEDESCKYGKGRDDTEVETIWNFRCMCIS